MLYISQNCVCSHLYKDLYRVQFNNPFIWCVIDYNSMKNLITKWNDLNFYNYKLVANDDGITYSIIIDDCIKVQYIHYKKSKQYKYPHRIGPDIFVEDVESYVVKKYLSRLKRMVDSKETPTFCLVNINTIFPDCIYSDEELSDFEQYDNTIVIHNTNELEPIQVATLLYSKYIKKTINVCYVATDNFYQMCHKSIESLIKSKYDSVNANITIVTPKVTNFFDDLNSDTVKINLHIVPEDKYFNDIKESDYDESLGGLQNHNFKYGFYKIECLKLPYDRVLFLDCDTIIFRDISELFTIEMDKELGVVADTWEVPDGRFNSGVMLFNNKMLRDTNIYDEFIRIAKTENTNDQSVFINMFMPNKLMYLNPVYHFSPKILFSTPNEINLYLNDMSFNNAVKHPMDFGLMKLYTDNVVKIVHLYGTIKGNYEQIYNYLLGV